MKERCIQAVERAAGREITQREAQGIEDRMSKHMRLNARRAPEDWRKLSEQQRMAVAAQGSIDEMLFEAGLQKYRLERQIEVHDKLTRETGQWEGGRLDALKRLTVSVTDGKGSFRSIETLATSIRTDALRQLGDVFESLDPRMWGMFENKEGVTAFTRALYGKTEGVDPKIVKAAEAWKKVAEDLRGQFNSAGGKIGKLADWVMPQNHSQLKVAKAGADQWVADTMPKLDRQKYVNDDGTLMTDKQVEGFLREAWKSIATNGMNDIEPGQQGVAMQANRRAAHREIHFKGPEDAMAYGAQYSDKALLETMVDHVSGLGRDIAAVETFGPNPAQTFAFFRDTGLKEAANTDPAHIGRYEQQAVKITNLWNFLNGERPPVASEWLARGFDATRNWLVSTRLGGAVLSSISDEGTIAVTARVNNLPYMQVFRNELAGMNLANKEELRQARRAGLAMDTMIGDLNRWGQDTLGSTLPAKLAHATLRASGLNAITDVRRRAFGATMMDSIGHLTRDTATLAHLDEHDNRILLSKGVTEDDWQVWRAATPEQWGNTNHTVLTPDAIYKVPDAAIEHLIPDLALRGEPGTEAYKLAAQKIRRDAALKLIGAVAEEVDMAVVSPKALEREMVGGGLVRGTWKGELTRSVFLFKTTPLAVVMRHWSRGLAQDTNAGKAAYIGSLIASTTLLGAFTMQIKELIAGRDPKNMNPVAGDFGVRNWVQAFLQGGSFGLYGDFLFSGTTRHETSPTAAFLGPVISGFEEMFNLTQGNLVQMAQGKKTNAGAELVRFAKSNIPMANLWYTKAALDHLVVHNLQELMSPGYLATMERKARRTSGTSYYWAPGDATPDRGPDMGRAIGQ